MKTVLTGLVCILFVIPPSLLASGACCAVTQVGAPVPTLAIVTAFADGHEEIGGEEYTLEQLAAVVKVSWPVGRGFTLQGQLGVPFSQLTPHMGMDGRDEGGHGTPMTGEGGVLYGAGLGYRIPETWELVDLFASLGAGQSYGRLTDEGGEAVDRTFVISEVQALFLAEFPLFEWGGLYAGARFYYGKNRLESAGEPDLHGEREGNVGGVFGARFRPTERVTVTAEYGNGHTRIYSIGTIIALSE